MSKVINEIFFINPITLEVTRFDGQKYIKADLDYLKKDNLITSRMFVGDLATHSFKISTHTPKSEIPTAIELRMHDDIGLDPNQEQIIRYIKKELNYDGNFQIDSFAITSELLAKKFKKIVRKTEHIDFIGISRLSFITLYHRGILDTKNVDLFISIDKNEAFGVIYKKGEYVASISLPTIFAIQKKVESSARITVKEVEDYLTTKGFLAKSYEPKERKIFDILQTSFIEVVSQIDNIITNNRSKYGVGGIDRVYISVGGKRVPNINSIFELSGMNIKSINTLDIIPEARKHNPLDSIVMSHIYDKLRIEDNSENFTNFFKKPPFFKTYVGKFVLINLFLPPLVTIYPLYLQYQAMQLEDGNQFLQSKLQRLQREANGFKAKINVGDKKIASLRVEQNKILIQKRSLNQTVIKLKQIKILGEYSKMLLEINDVLKKYKLSTVKFEELGKFKMNVVLFSKSKQRENIAKFMKDLLLLGYNRSYTNEIRLSDDLYKSVIKIEK